MQGICRSSWTLCLYEIENEVILEVLVFVFLKMPIKGKF